MAPMVIVTASTGAFPGLVDALRAIPVEVEEHPLMTFAPPLDWTDVDAAIGDLWRYEAVAFTSPRSARAFVGRMAALGHSGSARTMTWAAGPGTMQALGEALGPVRGPDERTAGERGAAVALAGAMLATGIRGPVLFPCGERRRDELPTLLTAHGVEVREAVCYRAMLAEEADARLAAERAQVLLVASPTVAALLARACP
ncbi:MAG: uroporphyrinogen-III synthase, partial [Gemmatimonadales bacterium]|nr:uroporphyrinogen-III synthase [Gemmatimonadales bacterium]